MPIARQRVTKHIPAEMCCGTIGRSFIGNELLTGGVFRRVRADWIYESRVPKLIVVQAQNSCCGSTE
jgi:hypothetical protein